jgi:hypothetical protein
VQLIANVISVRRHLREKVVQWARRSSAKRGPEVSRCPMATTMVVHPLAYPWTFTYFKKVANKSYEENTFTLGTTETVEDFWRLYVHLRRPVDERPTVCDYHVFREGIRPMWEDDANRDGGKWIVRLKKGLVARFWEDIVRSSLHTRRATTTNASRKRRSPRPTCGLVRSYWPSSAVSSAWATRSAAACSRFATKRTSSPCGTNPPTRAAFACRSATRCAPSCPCPRVRPWSVSSDALKRAPPRARCTLSPGPSTHAHASITLDACSRVNHPRTHIVPLAQTKSTPTRCATTAPTATRTPTSEPHSSFFVDRATRACVQQ